jgi:hypothetical protein
MRSSLLLEAVVVGVMTSTLFYSLQYMNTGLSVPWLLFFTGALIHIVFEFTGANEWWCKQTYKI